MPTALGAIFILSGIFCFFFRENSLFGLLIVASVFQASSAIMFGEHGVQPYYFIEIFILVKALSKSLLGRTTSTAVPYAGWLLTFGMVAIISAFVGPFLFSGTPIYEPLLGIDEGMLVRPPLHFGFSNVTQSVYLAFHIATAFAILKLDYSAAKTRKAYLIAFYFVVFCVFTQAFCRVTGIPFPDFLVRNNPNIWDLATSPGLARKPGTFLEPSFAGAFLLFCCVGFMAEYLAGKGSALRVALAIVASGMVTSSGSLLSLALAAVALIFRYSPFRFPWYIRMGRVKRLGFISLLVLLPVLLGVLFSADSRTILLESTISKGETGSFVNRTTADLYALQLLVQTRGFGVGLGSNRASSLVTSLVSNAGIIGLLAFGVFFYKLLAHVPKEHAWVKWAGFALILNMMIGVPDVTFPILWVAIMFAVRSTQQDMPLPKTPAPLTAAT